MDYSRRADFKAATERAAPHRIRGGTFHAARVSPTPRIVTIIYSPRLPGKSQLCSKTAPSNSSAPRLSESQPYGYPTITLSQLSTNGAAVMAATGLKSGNLRLLVPHQSHRNRSLYMIMGHGHKCCTLFAISYWFKPCDE